jgi:choline transport protein
VTLLYGILVVAVPSICTGLTLAELSSIFRIAGGQYHFTSILAPIGWSNTLSQISGTAALFSWFAVFAGTILISANIIFALVIQYDLSFVPKPWHYFLVYQVLNVLSALYNIYLVKLSPKIYDLSCEHLRFSCLPILHCLANCPGQFSYLLLHA